MSHRKTDRIDCGIVIALREEYVGKDPFGGFGTIFQVDSVQQSESFITFTFHDRNGDKRRGVVGVMQAMTPLHAYETTRNLIDRYAPEIMINIGLAGALSKHLRLGDVLFADYVDNYDSGGKATAAGANSFELHWAGQPYHSSEDLFNKLQRIWAYRSTLHLAWQDRCDSRLIAGLPTDILQTLRKRQMVGDTRQLEAGPIASGDTVGAAEAFKARLLERNRKLLAMEMESAGFLKACIAASPSYPRVVIKTISDLADENKEELDKTSGDSIRAWAMSNALDLLGTICRQLLSFAELSSGQNAVYSSEDLADKLLEFAVQKQIKKQHKGLLKDLDSALKQYDTLFRPILVPNKVTARPNLFAAFAEVIGESHSPYPLRINGKPGSGKTTFLTLLYLALYRRSKDIPTAPVPCFINLKRYTMPDASATGGSSAAASIQDDFAILQAALESHAERPLVILLDGIDEYVRYDENVEREILNLIEGRSSAKKIIGVGLNYLADREKFRRNLSHLSGAELSVTLNAINIDQEQTVETFVRAFQAIHAGTVDESSTVKVIQRARSFRLQSVDLLLVSKLFDSIGVDRYAQVATLSDFFSLYCDDILHRRGSTETIAQAAKLAFDFTVRPDPVDLSPHVHSRAWKLLHSHPTIKDFLVAYHAVHLVGGAGKGTNEAHLQDLNYVYPHKVNRFCKDIVNSSWELQWDVLQGAKRIFLDGGENAKPHACYLVGRLSDHDARLQAGSWLRETAMPEVLALQAKPDNKIKPGELLLCRTVYISLAYLGDEEASNEYLYLLTDRQAWNNVNRGFHLEYYADIPFDPERQLSHEDRLGSFTRTYESLRERIVGNINNRDYGLFNIEVFTLYSLAQHRHARRGRLPENIRLDLLSLIPRLLDADNVSAQVRDYLLMLEDNLQEPDFPVGRLAEQLYGLKTEIRAGWVERHLDVERIESVAEHTIGTCVLGLLYLPEGNPENWQGYDKTEVLQMLMIHDLAEALSGDVTFRNSTDATREKERQAFRYIMMCRTYPRVADLQSYYERWEQFEAAANENARIARDLDRLENLMQLYLYQRVAEVEDYQDWKTQLISNISTPAGKRILDIIRDNFEGERVQPTRSSGEQGSTSGGS